MKKPGLFVVLLFGVCACETSRPSKPLPPYSVGEFVSEKEEVDSIGTTSLRNMERRNLRKALASSSATVNCLIFLGGIHGEEEKLWCGDSEQEIPLLQRLEESFRDAPIKFWIIACPPVYGDGGYGDARAHFLEQDTRKFTWTSREQRFVSGTREFFEKLGFRMSVLYDLHFCTLLNFERPLPVKRHVEPWEGRFKAHEDKQTYGTPTIWILSRDGEAMCEPFWGNNYPNKIRYRYEDIAAAIERALQTIESRSNRKP